MNLYVDVMKLHLHVCIFRKFFNCPESPNKGVHNKMASDGIYLLIVREAQCCVGGFFWSIECF